MCCCRNGCGRLAAAGAFTLVTTLYGFGEGMLTASQHSWWPALGALLAGAALFGFLVVVFTSGPHRVLVSALAGLDPDQRSVAMRASFRYPVPADASVLRAAVRINQHRIRIAGVAQRWFVIVAGVDLAALMATSHALSGLSAADLIELPACIVLAVVAWQVLRNAEHRGEALQAAHGAPNRVGG